MNEVLVVHILNSSDHLVKAEWGSKMDSTISPPIVELSLKTAYLICQH